MSRIYIIGFGPGNPDHLSALAQRAIEESDCLVGDKRLTAAFEGAGKSVFHTTRAHDIVNFINKIQQEGIVSVLVSGDLGFFSLAKTLIPLLDQRDQVELIPGISSLQYFAARLQTSWDDAVISSLHGRTDNLVIKVLRNEKVFVLTGGAQGPAAICRLLTQYGLDQVQVDIAENLSYEDERIISGRAGDLVDGNYASLSVMMIRNSSDGLRKCITHGFPDDWFQRGDVPMTKQEIRAVSISKLQLASRDIVYDIGAGTGSVAIEIALQVDAGAVYAIEKEEEGIQLIEKNKHFFCAANLTTLKTTAPSGMEHLPVPDKVFIGGSSGNLHQILDLVYQKNPEARVVINAISLETLSEASSYYQKREDDYQVEFVNVMISKAKKLGDYHLMFGQNPIFVITAEKRSNKNRFLSL